MKIQNAFRVGLIGTLGVGVGLLIISSVVTLQTIITYIGAALFLSLGLDPAVSWLEKKKFPRRWAILTVLAVVLSVLTGMVFAVAPIIVDQVSKLSKAIPDLVKSVNSSTFLTDLQNQFPGLEVSKIVTSVTDFLGKNLTSITSTVIQSGIAVVSGLFGALIILILTLYFTASLNGMKHAMYQLVPASKRERFADLSEQITTAVGRFVIGQGALALCNGVLSFIFLSIIGAPFPALLALIAFLFSLVPLIGTITGSIIIVLTCLIPGIGSSPFTALVAAIYYLIYMQVEAYLLSPNIMNRAVAVPGALVVVAALAGGSLLGILGALIAIPVAAAAIMIIKQVVVPRQNEL
ncbi:AI-2E family transporter [Cryobacterium sp. TMT1-21]|uniref:AI-2E family transporter n=1 Tax=Cryobacterium shii TaxID=1259235 RepID=A0AAQ2HGQ6_9MICO|nr:MULTISPECIES: AI-2E family transporter [Cryobacterium]TFC52383.1 AI-2E family transporter [Cryobacterium shii]TFC87487.1 AI-2E family transporter [Cryobacterium sp. TmT2-59]TFD10851.1 AI-2E family transporter [Cryobacterium sp. TMT1-21]TFD16543.1 AI-2E family transporter [Cryobacterium sp. TMT2-23]TFD20512.1 AI-2E family transporter [Cryobacterium sp. TMT4-10]